MSTAALLGACGSSASTSSAGTSAGGSSAAPLQKVTVALDYVANNAGYDGLYAAQKLGYFEKEGLSVTFLPYANTSADVLVNAGKADFGTIDQPSLIIDDAADEKFVSIMDIMQHEASRLAVRSSLHVTSPKQLTGKTFGGFGIPMEDVFNNATIKGAGGVPSYKTVTLGTDVYTALTGGQVDWAIPYATDDILWAKLRGHPFTVFDPQDYGVPDDYGKLLFSSQSFLAGHAGLTRKFVAAAQKGYTWAAAHPAKATVLLDQSNVGTMNMTDQTATAKDLAQNYWLDSNGVVGPETASKWQVFTAFLTKAHVLKNKSGKVLTTPPSSNTWFTNQYLAKG